MLRPDASIGGVRHRVRDGEGRFTGDDLTVSGEFYHAEGCPLLGKNVTVLRSDGTGGEAFFDEVRFLSPKAFGALIGSGISAPGSCDGSFSEISFIRGRVMSDPDMTNGASDRERLTVGSGSATVRSGDGCFSPETVILGGAGFSAVDGSVLVFSSLAADLRTPPGPWIPSSLALSDPAVYAPSGDMVMSADAASFRWPGEDLGKPGRVTVRGGSVSLGEILPADFLESLSIPDVADEKSFEIDIGSTPYVNGDKAVSFTVLFEGLLDISGQIRLQLDGVSTDSLMAAGFVSAALRFSDLGIMDVYKAYNGETPGEKVSGMDLPGPAMFEKGMTNLGEWVDGLRGKTVEVTANPGSPVKVLAIAAMFAMRGDGILDTLGVETKTP